MLSGVGVAIIELPILENENTYYPDIEEWRIRIFDAVNGKVSGTYWWHIE